MNDGLVGAGRSIEKPSINIGLREPVEKVDQRKSRDNNGGKVLFHCISKYIRFELFFSRTRAVK